MAFVQVASSETTFFEMLAVERFLPSLKAAVVYALSVYAQHRPNLQRLLDHDEELFFLINILLDRHSLLQNNASFAESLYALHRLPTATTTVPSPPPPTSSSPRALPVATHTMSPWQRRSSLMLLTLVPYLRAKLDSLYAARIAQSTAAAAAAAGGSERNRISSDSTISDAAAQQPAYSLFRSPFASRLVVQRQILDLFQRAYPFIASAHEGSRFVYQLFYLLGKTRYFSPELHALGLVVARVSGQDVAAAEQQRATHHSQRLQQARSGGGGPAVRAVREGWVKVSSSAGTHTRSALILAVFGYKLLEWWYTSAEQKLGRQKAPAPPPPPPPPLPSPRGIKLPTDLRLCPLCKQRRTNPSMIATSGYVFCYPCAYTFVQGNGCCPVTRFPARVDQIRRLYLSGGENS